MRSDWLSTNRLSAFMTHRLIFARAYWRKHITWYKIGRRLSGVLRVEKPRNRGRKTSSFTEKLVFLKLNIISPVPRGCLYNKIIISFNLQRRLALGGCMALFHGIIVE